MKSRACSLGLRAEREGRIVSLIDKSSGGLTCRWGFWGGYVGICFQCLLLGHVISPLHVRHASNKFTFPGRRQ